MAFGEWEWRCNIHITAVQIFAAEMKGPKDRPQDRPKGAFGQEYPQHVSSEASSPAVTGPLKVRNCLILHWSGKVTQHDMPLQTWADLSSTE